MKKIDLVIDLQFGSTGKGLVSSYLSYRGNYDTVISANMPNAGHTAYCPTTDRKMVHKVLPSGLFSPGHKDVLVGPGAVFRPEQLAKELLLACDIGLDITVYIHSQAVLLTDDMVKAEESSAVTKIASTAQGSKEALVAKLNRDPDANPTVGANAHKLRDALGHLSSMVEVVSHSTWISIIADSENILAEGAQGYSLGVSQDFYPYCTSRECTPARFMSDMALPLPMLRKVIGVCRTYPIRVGNTADGESGPVYADQEEITWGNLGVQNEITTVTGRVRRVFTWSDHQMQDAVAECCPDEIFINFMNYLSPVEMLKFYASVSAKYPIRYLGLGPRVIDVVDMDCPEDD